MQSRFSVAISAILLTIIVVNLSACSHGDNHGFDPSANPFIQLEQARSRARSEHKNILLMAGGAWCHWCRALDSYIHSDGDLSAGFDSAFVTVKIYTGDDNDNKRFFATLPAAPGVPHFWVLDEQGQLLQSQGTGEFETGKDQYSKQKLMDFIAQWHHQ